MQERVERWLSYWGAKPLSWLVVWLWLALKYGWLRIAWCAIKLREKWRAWRAKRAINGTPVDQAELPPINVPTRRLSKRQAA